MEDLPSIPYSHKALMYRKTMSWSKSTVFVNTIDRDMATISDNRNTVKSINRFENLSLRNDSIVNKHVEINPKRSNVNGGIFPTYRARLIKLLRSRVKLVLNPFSLINVL